MYLNTLVIGLILVGLGQCEWLNDFDADLNFSCRDGEYMTTWKSIHENYYDDRRWDLKCTASGIVGTDCSWTDDYVNSWDGDMDYSCPTDTILTGASSIHDNSYDDRRWKFRCCKIATTPGKNCKWTSYLNDWDDPMDYTNDPGWATVGVSSYHKNYYDDRRYKLKVCEFTICTARKITILDEIEPSLSGGRVVGVATAQGCSPAATYLVNLGTTDSVAYTYGLTIGSSSTFSYSHSLEVESETSVGFLGTGGSVSVGVTNTIGGSVTAESSETHETTTESGSSSGMTVSFNGPAGAMILGHVKKYIIDQSSVNVKVNVVCEDGNQFEEKTTMAFTSTTYGQAHYTNQIGKYNEGKCTDESNTCLLALESNYALDADRMVEEFGKCFSNGGGTVSFNQLENTPRKLHVSV